MGKLPRACSMQQASVSTILLLWFPHGSHDLFGSNHKLLACDHPCLLSGTDYTGGLTLSQVSTSTPLQSC